MQDKIRLIVALDFESQIDALKLVEQLDLNRCALKVGSELFTRFGMNFVDELISRRFSVFLDLKFHDIPNTVAKACMAAAEMGVWMLTLHASGGLAMMQAARQAVQSYEKNRPLLIAVTVLTSLPSNDLLSIGVNAPLENHVIALANLAQQAGMDGVVSSAWEVPVIKAACGSDFLVVTPGIRRRCDVSDDQSRIVTPESALKVGSDYWVVGRPITRAANPKAAFDDFWSLSIAAGH